MGSDISAYLGNFLKSFQLLLPFVLFFILFALDTVSIDLSFWGTVKPNLTLIAIYYWSIYRPTLIPVWLVFVMGLLRDFLNYTTLGLNALLWIMIYLVITAQRKTIASQSFLVVFIGFAITLILSEVAKVFLFTILNGYEPNYLSMVFSVLSGLLIFPWIYSLLFAVHRILPMNTDETLIKTAVRAPR